MFKPKDFDRLNKIWDGSLSNSKEVCGGLCKGMCCHNTEKILFPNEYDYLVDKTGQRNTDWKSSSCLCWELEKSNAKLKPFRPIICKLFPLDVNVPLVGKVTFDHEIGETDYTSLCAKLVISKQDAVKIQAWLDFLFSDVHNRFYYIYSLVLPDELEDERKILSDMGKDPDNTEDLIDRAIFKAVGIPTKNHFSHYNFDLEK